MEKEFSIHSIVNLFSATSLTNQIVFRGSGYLGTHNYPSFIRSCIDIAKPINIRKNLVSEFHREEDSN